LSNAFALQRFHRLKPGLHTPEASLRLLANG
jgi:hypothetical protein